MKTLGTALVDFGVLRKARAMLSPKTHHFFAAKAIAGSVC